MSVCVAVDVGALDAVTVRVTVADPLVIGFSVIVYPPTGVLIAVHNKFATFQLTEFPPDVYQLVVPDVLRNTPLLLVRDAVMVTLLPVDQHIFCSTLELLSDDNHHVVTDEFALIDMFVLLQPVLHPDVQTA